MKRETAAWIGAAMALANQLGGDWLCGVGEVAELVDLALLAVAALERVWCRKKSSAALVCGVGGDGCWLACFGKQRILWWRDPGALGGVVMVVPVVVDVVSV